MPLVLISFKFGCDGHPKKTSDGARAAIKSNVVSLGYGLFNYLRNINNCNVWGDMILNNIEILFLYRL